MPEGGYGSFTWSSTPSNSKQWGHGRGPYSYWSVAGMNQFQKDIVVSRDLAGASIDGGRVPAGKRTSSRCSPWHRRAGRGRAATGSVCRWRPRRRGKPAISRTCRDWITLTKKQSEQSFQVHYCFKVCNQKRAAVKFVVFFVLFNECQVLKCWMFSLER